MKIIVKEPNKPMEIREWDINPYSLNNYKVFNDLRKEIIGKNGIDHMTLRRGLVLYCDDIGALLDDRQFNFLYGGAPIFQPVIVVRYANEGYDNEMLVDVSEDDITFCRSFMEK